MALPMHFFTNLHITEMLQISLLKTWLVKKQTNVEEGWWGLNSSRSLLLYHFFSAPTVSEVLLTLSLLPAAAFKISNAKIANWITSQIRFLAQQNQGPVHLFQHFRIFILSLCPSCEYPPSWQPLTSRPPRFIFIFQPSASAEIKI